MVDEKYKKYKEIKENLVLTYHGKDNLHERRPHIRVDDVVKAIAWGNLGFAGHRRYKSTDFKNNIEVIWKRDRETGEYVVITYYRISKNKYKLFRKFS